MTRSVLLLTQQLRNTRSGVGAYARVLVAGLEGRCDALTVATWTAEHDEESFPRARWIDLGSPPRWDPTPGAFLALGARLADALRAQPREFDVVFFTDAREAARVLAKSALPPGARLVGTVHDDYAAIAPASPAGYFGRARDPLRRWLYYRWLARLETRTYRRFDALCTNAGVTADRVAAAYGLERARLHVTPLCGAPEATADDAIADLAGTPALLFSGGNFYRKGLDVLVRALPGIVAEAPAAHLHVAGHDPARRAIGRLARGLGVEDRITFHGRVERSRMAALMRSATLFVMPSRTEALGLVYLEAMAAGTPVVSGDQGGVTEIVRDGETGLTVPVEDEAALTAAVLRLVRDGELRTRLVKGGRELASGRTPERLVEATWAVVREI